MWPEGRVRRGQGPVNTVEHRAPEPNYLARTGKADGRAIFEVIPTCLLPFLCQPLTGTSLPRAGPFRTLAQHVEPRFACPFLRSSLQFRFLLSSRGSKETVLRGSLSENRARGCTASGRSTLMSPVRSSPVRKAAQSR